MRPVVLGAEVEMAGEVEKVSVVKPNIESRSAEKACTMVLLGL